MKKTFLNGLALLKFISTNIRYDIDTKHKLLDFIELSEYALISLLKQKFTIHTNDWNYQEVMKILQDNEWNYHINELLNQRFNRKISPRNLIISNRLIKIKLFPKIYKDSIKMFSTNPIIPEDNIKHLKLHINNRKFQNKRKSTQNQNYCTSPHQKKILHKILFN